MLYDDSDQVEVRYVISLSHHDVSIYGGGDYIPEGELWIKRNAICLSRKLPQSDADGLSVPTLPFYLFSDNPSEKEDLYFAIIKNLEKFPNSPNSPPTAQQFDVKDTVDLVKRLHSSGENLQTRWFNALVGRLFLALYKTSELESHIWTKISKKISRVKKPNFITSIVLRKINPGEGAPLITNPRLKDLTVDGNCCVEMDFSYSGNFRIEIAATARIDLGPRFKAREVDLVLAVVLKKLKGHGLLRFKPPPSNRVWISFETMPDMEMSIEPIVSSRQITYGVILRAIESRIREVVGETLVLPYWDDIPFFDTSRQRYRGGIWEEASNPNTGHGVDSETASGEGQHLEPKFDIQETLITESQPLTAVSTPPSPAPDAWDKNTLTLDDTFNELDNFGHGGPLSSPKHPIASESEPALNSGSFGIEEPLLDAKFDGNSATSTTIDVPNHTHSSSPNMLHNRSRQRSVSSFKSNEPFADARPRADSVLSKASTGSLTEHSDGEIGSLAAGHAITSRSGSFLSTTKHHDARQTMNTLGSAAAAAAKKWGLNVLGRSDPSSRITDRGIGAPDQPIGRGRPLPPPGTPLPPPERSAYRVNPISIPKRKPLAPQLFPESAENKAPELRSPRHRKSNASTKTENGLTQEELLIIKAPSGSEPNSPLPVESRNSQMSEATDLNTNTQSAQSEEDPELVENREIHEVPVTGLPHE